MECVSVRVLILNIFELLFTESNRTESKLETQSNAINQNRIESNQIESNIICNGTWQLDS